MRQELDFDLAEKHPLLWLDSTNVIVIRNADDSGSVCTTPGPELFSSAVYSSYFAPVKTC